MGNTFKAFRSTTKQKSPEFVFRRLGKLAFHLLAGVLALVALGRLLSSYSS